MLTSSYNIIGLWQAWLNSGNLLLSAIAVLIYAIGVMIVIAIFSYMFGWAERKIIAKIQHRHGPTYVGKYGILQNLADLIKLLSKENIVPSNANLRLMQLSVIFILSASTFLVLILPFAHSLQVANFGTGLLIVFVFISFMPLAVFVGGVSSGNKFGHISAQRSVLMLLSYELPMVLVVAAAAMLSGSFNIQQVVLTQASRGYFALLMPIGFVIFFIAMLAEFERPPFDIREADSELISGWLTDFSSPYYALVLFIDYTRMFLGSLLVAIIFLGGWSGPVLPGPVWLIFKATLVALFTIIIRATTVRMRIDRMLRLGWMWLLPLSLINLILTYIIFVA